MNRNLISNSAWSEKPLRKLAVFTSPRAVEFGLPFIPPHDQLDDLEIAVVGSATRAKLEASGYPVHLQARSGFTSEDLMQVPELAEEPGTAVIFCAPGGRDTIAKGLRDYGLENHQSDGLRTCATSTGPPPG